MKKTLFLLSLVLSVGVTLAQQCLSHVMINGQRSEGAACYFVEHGEDRTAFVKISQFAELLGLNVSESFGTLRLERGAVRAELTLTTDPLEGLVRQPNVLFVEDHSIESSMGIIFAGQTFVPLVPLIRAFGGSSSWDESNRTVVVAVPPAARAPVAMTFSSVPTSNNALMEANPLPSMVIVPPSAETPLLAEVEAEAGGDLTAITDAPAAEAVAVAEVVEDATVAVGTVLEETVLEETSLAAASTVTTLEVTAHAAAAPITVMPMSTLLVEAAAASPTSSLSPRVVAAPAQAGAAAGVTAGATASSGLLGRPRLGSHAGFTRVVLDLPRGVEARYSVRVVGEQLRVTLPGVQAEPFRSREDNPYLRSLAYEMENGQLTLVLTGFESLSEQSYRVERLEVSAASPHERLFVDIGPGVALSARPGVTEAVWRGVTQEGGELSRVAPARGHYVVVIDAGHGGKDPGAVYFGIRESDVALGIAMRLKSLLELRGIEVIMTRTGDYHLNAQKTADLAARAALATGDRTLFVSIHANAANNSSAEGIETWVFGQPLDRHTTELAIRENGGGVLGEENTRLAQTVAGNLQADIFRNEHLQYSRGLADAVQRRMVQATGARDRGVRQNVFYVIKNARIPAVLVEVGFMSNPSEGRRLATAGYQATLAEALAGGIVEFLQGNGIAAR